MAKSLRSKHNRAFRAKKRDDDKCALPRRLPPLLAPAHEPAQPRRSAYKIAQDLRMQRMSAQLKASSLKPRALTDKEEWERKQEGYETVSEDGEQTAPADGKADGGTARFSRCRGPAGQPSSQRGGAAGSRGISRSRTPD